MSQYSSAEADCFQAQFTYKVSNFQERSKFFTGDKKCEHIIRSSQFNVKGFEDRIYEGFIVIKSAGYHGRAKVALNMKVRPKYWLEPTFHFGPRTYAKCVDYTCVMTANLGFKLIDKKDFIGTLKETTQWEKYEEQEEQYLSLSGWTFDKISSEIPDQSATLIVIVDLKFVSREFRNSNWTDSKFTTFSTQSAVIPIVDGLSKDGLFDLIISCDGKEFPVHKLVLSCVSPVFRAMLQTQMLEASTSRILIEDFSEEDVENMLDFIYRGTFNPTSDNSVLNLLYCADKYDIRMLKDHCLNYMLFNVTNFNAKMFVDVAEKFADNDVMKEFVFRTKN